MNTKVIIAAVALGCVAVAGAVVVFSDGKAAFAKREPTVEVAVAQSGSTSTSVMSQGVVVPVASTNVSLLPKLSGQVTQVNVDVGDHVIAGQVLAVVSPVDEQSDLQAAQATEQSAQANLALIERPYRPEELEQAKLMVQRDYEKMDEAKARLALLKHGHQPLEIEAANAKVDSAKATLAQNQSELDRDQQLFDKELVAKADLEVAKTNVALAKSALAQAKADRDLLVAGTRPELISEAQAAVRAAEADLKADEAAYRIKLLGSRPEKIQAAAADVRKAQVAVGAENNIIARQFVRAPISGVIIDRNVNPGELTQTSWSSRTDNDHPMMLERNSLFQIADDTTVEFRANVDQRFYHSVHLGQTCSISVEPELGQTFSGKIVRMKPVINPDFNKTSSSAPDTPDLPLTFQIWVRVPNPSHNLVMGETGVLTVDEKTAGITIPQSALNAFASGKGVVYVEQGGFVKATSVRYADVSDGQVRILSGIRQGDHVVVSSPYKLSDGMAVKTVSSDGTGVTPM